MGESPGLYHYCMCFSQLILRHCSLNSVKQLLVAQFGNNEAVIGRSALLSNLQRHLKVNNNNKLQDR